MTRIYNTDDEEWRDIPGFETFYMVSNFGNGYSVTRSILRSNGRWRYVRGKYLNPGINRNGYPYFSLRIRGFQKILMVHRAVALAFMPNPENYPVINHMDGIKTNNHLDNLEWCTQYHNAMHAINTGLNKDSLKNGEENMHSILTNDSVRYIRENSTDNGGSFSNEYLSELLGVTKPHVRRIVIRKRWAHI